MTTLEKLQKADKNNLVTKKDGSLKKRVIEAINYFCNNNGHFQYYTGSGRHIRLVSYDTEIYYILRILGYKWQLLNDAPRGGQNGRYYKISKIAMNSIKSLMS